jgi:rhodanese-related sulfurtransferase
MANSLARTAPATLAGDDSGTVLRATWGDSGQTTGEVTTEDVRRILLDGSATVIDTRSNAEFAAGHLPGVRHIPTKADGPAAEYVEAVERLVGGDKAAPLVLYCNGPFCKRTRSLGKHLVAAGFSNVRRYQLGIPIWRALGGPTEIEVDGVLRVHRLDRTAVFFDARSPEDYALGSILGAHNVPADGSHDEIMKAPLPREDFHSRVVLFGRDFAQARKLAEVLSETPFHNVLYFPGRYETLAAAAK